MIQLYYIHDPMCSWCWGFCKTWNQLYAALPKPIEIVRLLGELAEDSGTPMPASMQQKIAETWRTIAMRIPGVQFNFDFWKTANPRRATYAACRAVIAARRQGDDYDLAMTQAIQRAYYLQARNPSDESTLIELAGEIGLEKAKFTRDLCDPQTQAELLKEIADARNMDVESFPSLVLKRNGFWHIPIDYNNHRPMLELIQQLIAGDDNF